MPTDGLGDGNESSIVIDASVRWRWMHALAVTGIVVLAVILILPAIQQQREAARRTQSKNNLKQMGLALGNYHDTHQCFPPGGTFDSASRGYHGWGIQMYPYLDSSPLFNQVNFNQPWNSPDNADCFRLKLYVFLNPSIDAPKSEPGFSITHYSANSHLMAANSCVRLWDVEDAGSMFAMGELGGDFIPWGCPYNWRPLQGLTNTPRTYGRIENFGGQFVMVDSSVRWISPDIDPEVLAKLRGPDLASKAGARLCIVRPESFPFPANARERPQPTSRHRPSK